MRHLDRNGSLHAALETLEARGFRAERVGVFRRSDAIAPRLRRLEPHGPVLFNVEGFSYIFVAGVVSRREQLYKLLGVQGDVEAYKLVEELKPGKLEDFHSFDEYYQRVGDKLELLPAIKFYEGDGGYYTTSSLVIACHRGVCNASIHRVMVSYDYSYAAMRVVPRHLHALLNRAGGRLPVAIVYGVDPVLLLVAALSPPLGVFELALAKQLMPGMPVCKSPRYGLPVPCTASMVVEAVLGPDRAPEGPFVDLLDLYDRRRMEPVVHVEDVYLNRKLEPIIHAILPGGLEHRLLMGLPREAAIYAAVARAVPHVSKVRLTLASGMWLHAVISIRKQHDGDGKSAAFAALAAHPSLKHVVVVDDDIDPDNPEEVEWAIATRFQAGRGLVVVPHARGSTLDPSSADGLTYKVIVDATAPIGERERYRRVTG